MWIRNQFLYPSIAHATAKHTSMIGKKLSKVKKSLQALPPNSQLVSVRCNPLTFKRLPSQLASLVVLMATQTAAKACLVKQTMTVPALAVDICPLMAALSAMLLSKVASVHEHSLLLLTIALTQMMSMKTKEMIFFQTFFQMNYLPIEVWTGARFMA